jgi:6-pyruvoyltetrahydropterin/6-carboxytetrahydropterin synthase
MFEVGVVRSFRARHIMPGREGPEGRLHEHDYRVEVVVEAPQLDDEGMVCDIDVLDRRLAALVSRLEARRVDEVVPAKGGVTVEAMARWIHGEIAEALGGISGGAIAVRVWESGVAFGGYRGQSSA